MNKLVAAVLLLVLAACEVPAPGTSQGGPLVMTRFVQSSPEQVWFSLSGKIEAAGVVRTAAVPRTVPDQLPQYEFEPLQQVEGTLTLELEERHVRQPRSIIVVILPEHCRAPVADGGARFRIKPGCNTVEYLEFVRHPAAWLLERFDFNRADGSTILGRRTIAVRQRAMKPPAPYVFYGAARVDLKTVDPGRVPEEVAGFPELVTAVRVVSWLWRHDMRAGPDAMPYDRDFIALSLERKLTMAGNGQFAIMCQGMRDLFLHAVLSLPGIQARIVEAYDYAPQFAHLIAFSHATSEVYVGALAKWVMVDAWAGILIARRDGTLLSAEEIRRADPAELRIVPMLDRARRYYTAKGGARTPAPYDPASVKLTQYTIDADGVAPGYLDYYKHLLYAEARHSPGGRPGPGD